MRFRRNRRLNQHLILAMTFSLLPLLVGTTAVADIAPPPPEVPGTNLELPGSASIAIGGMLLSVALVLAGLAAARRNSTVRSRMLYAGAAVIVLLAVGGSVVAARQHSDYEETLQNWGPQGPVEDLRD